MDRKEYLELADIYEKEGQNALFNIANVLHGNSYIDKCTLVSSAYVLLRANDSNADMATISSFCSSCNLDENRESFLESCLADYWGLLCGLRNRYTLNSLKSIVLFYEDRDMRFGLDCRTPNSIIQLANKLFDFGDNDDIADFGIGSAAYITETYLNHKHLNYYGIEINATIKEMAAIKLEVLGCPIFLEHGNIFDIDTDERNFHKIFANYPFGMRLRELAFDKNRLLQKIFQNSLDFSKGVSSDWYFNAALVECLSNHGKAIAVMTNGSTWNTLDRSARKYFIENGYLEAVIALPEKMFDCTNIPTTMVILSKNNRYTMLVDATSLCEKGRRSNSFNEEQIEKIVMATQQECEYSHMASFDELLQNDCVINPTRYLTQEITIENGVPFDTYIQSITRGAPIKASDLDEMVSSEPTEYQYLMLSNIQKGQIDAELPYLRSIDDNLRKYCVSNHSLILSKNGAPFKVAVAEVNEGQTILANGNLYVIELNEEIADPYFIKAFLESEKGIALLKSITVGATIPNIGVEQLKKILIPGFSIEKQKEVAAEYKAKIDEIALCNRKLQKLYGELNHIYDSKEW